MQTQLGGSFKDDSNWNLRVSPNPPRLGSSLVVASYLVIGPSLVPGSSVVIGSSLL